MNTQRFNLDNRNSYQTSAACPWATTTTATENHQQRGAYTSLSHHITVDLLNLVLGDMNPHAAPGIDKITHEKFRGLAPTELPMLVQQLRSRRYQCQPSMRVEIPKSSGVGTRPLGIPCMRDKVIQGAVKAILEPIYEGEFLSQSYGYRPKRGCHMALAALQQRLMASGGGFVIDMDLSKYFDSVPHQALMDFVRIKTKDPVILHAIWSCLKAGAMVPGKRRGELIYEKSTQGTPQGGVISPLLANIYLHYVLDDYIDRVIGPDTPGGVHFYRYADDVVCVVEEFDTATRVLDQIAKRVGEYGLQLNLMKTKILDCRRPDRIVDDFNCDGRNCRFLGYEMLWERSRSGAWKLTSRPAEGKTETSLEKARVRIRKKAAAGQSVGSIRTSIYSSITGFSNYFFTEGCEEDVAYYTYEMEKLLGCIRCAGDFDPVDDDLFDSVNWS